jgi:predicted dehydrogenase
MRRRELLKAAAFGAMMPGQLASVQSSPVAATDKIQVGMIGVGNFGAANLQAFARNPDVEIVAVCDVFEPNLERGAELAGGKPKRYRHYRRLLEDRNIQAVVITTPEHWHAIMCIDACEAGKDVYVEKPASHFIRDGRLMVEAARRNHRVVQVGTQQRSGTHFRRAVRHVQEGRIGAVHYASVWNHSPVSDPRRTVTAGPPSDLDWDMWLGPAPKLPYEEVWTVGRRGYWDFWGGMTTEWGTHLVDIVLWAMKVQGPVSTVAAGGRFYREWSQIPDTLETIHEYPGFLLQHSILNHNTFGLNGNPGAARFGSYGIQFHGTHGTLFVDRSGYRITPQPVRREEPDRPPPPPTTDSREPGFYYTTEVLAEESDSSVQHAPHVRNFLDCVKSRQKPVADIEAGHYANTVCRLGNIAYRVGRRLRWDGASESVVDDPEANKLVMGTYREPWVPKGL